MFRIRPRWLVILLSVPLVLWGCDHAVKTYWIGITDFELEIAITDTRTGNPVAGARIEFEEEDLPEEAPTPGFVLSADADGLARREWPDHRCSGSTSFFGRQLTLAIRPLFWRIRVSAPGFRTTEWIHLSELECFRRVERVGPHRMKVVVPIAMEAEGSEK